MSSQSDTSDNRERRRALLLLLLEHYLELPMSDPPGGWSAVIELEVVGRLADTPGIRDLDRIIAEGSHILSAKIIGGIQ